VALDYAFFTFWRGTYDLLKFRSRFGRVEKQRTSDRTSDRTGITVRTGVKILLNYNTRLQAAVREISKRSFPEKKEKQITSGEMEPTIHSTIDIKKKKRKKSFPLSHSF